MKTALALLITASVVLGQDGAKTNGTTKPAIFHSEDVQCRATLFLPKDFSPSAKSPAVVLAPGWGETAASLEKYATTFAAHGLVAMTIDYRGWGKSGGSTLLADRSHLDHPLLVSSRH